MRGGDSVTLAAMLFLAVVAWVQPVSAGQRRFIAGMGLAGAALIAVRQALALRFPLSADVAGDWLPCLLMLMVYWQSGRFFGTPREKLQEWLLEFDRRRLGRLLDRWAGEWSSTWVGNYLELAYLLCYLMIPCGVGVLYWTRHRGAIDQYWMAVLPASYVCYLLVPFAQTLPPRLLDGRLPAPSRKQKIRSFNLLIVRHASIHLNTFPSAHVAATVAASLALMRVVPAAGLVFLVIALSIAVAAVLGRYHYAMDVILGAMIPVLLRGLVG